MNESTEQILPMGGHVMWLARLGNLQIAGFLQVLARSDTLSRIWTICMVGYKNVKLINKKDVFR